jgi:nitronate monooxygenase
MFHFTQLDRPLVSAPMAGGVATPALVAAVSNAGGLGMLPGGYLDGEQLHSNITEVRRLTAKPFGVNLFVPETVQRVEGAQAVQETLKALETLAAQEARDWQRYRESLGRDAAELGVHLPDEPYHDDDHYRDKLTLLAHVRPAVVSFTFGLPAPETIHALQARDICCVATVTSLAEALLALAAGVNALCVQGPAAGGHRATFHVDDVPEEMPLEELVQAVRQRMSGQQTQVPLIAAGGIWQATQVRELLALGAAAVQVGTAFLAAAEAGTKSAHAKALTGPRFTQTITTRAFTGRPARGIVNTFLERHHDEAPALYPQLHYLTAPIRTAAAAQNNAEYLHLWAGTGFKHVQEAPAQAIMAELTALV